MILIYHFDYIAVQVTLGLTCIRGIFSSRIYVVDSRRNSVSTYFGKRDMIITPLVVDTSLVLGHWGLKLLADFSAISACSTSSFHVWALTVSIRTFTLSRKLCWHIWRNMGNSMSARHMREIAEPLKYSRMNYPPFWTVKRSLSMVTSVSSS